MPASTISISHLSHHVASEYLISVLGRVWAEQGWKVKVGAAYDSEARVCILHHDRTTLRAHELPAAPNEAPILNGHVLDISKRTYSRLALTRDDAWGGPVIVKTNLNHFGVPEKAGQAGGLPERVHERLARFDWRLARKLPRGVYPVLDSKADVPGWVWRDDSLIVEKFMPERTEDGLYCVRGWIFFGDQEYGYKVFSADPLVKVRSKVRVEYLDETPEELKAFRREKQFDFGKFDYVVHDGGAILLDANKTPTCGVAEPTPRLRKLAEGIEAFL